VNLVVRCWPDDQHWWQRLDEATTHIAGQAVRAAQENGCVGIRGVIRISRQNCSWDMQRSRSGSCAMWWSRPPTTSAKSRAGVARLGSVIEPQPHVTAQHRVQRELDRAR